MRAIRELKKGTLLVATFLLHHYRLKIGESPMNKKLCVEGKINPAYQYFT
jgi:hypothetical protein